MHFCLEIIMPPCPKEEIEDRISNILEPFNENNEDANQAFWDWWVISGRYSGTKITSILDEDKLDDFYRALQDNEVTVSSVVAGKERLAPESQIELVDNLWKEFFPNYPGEHCPLFAHAGSKLPGDIITFSELHPKQTAYRVIIAGENGVAYMVEREFWNGVTHIETKWDGKVVSAVGAHLDKLKNYSDEYREKVTPKDDWLVVTVDYHS